MFHGKAELIDPEKNVPVACFTETCQGDGTAKMKVVLATPISISGTERLAIYSTYQKPGSHCDCRERRNAYRSW